MKTRKKAPRKKAPRKAVKKLTPAQVRKAMKKFHAHIKEQLERMEEQDAILDKMLK